MPVYHQMGHHSENLLAEQDLNAYAGAILSPVNNRPGDLNAQIHEMRQCHFSLDILFDPQLYVPKSKRGDLPKWSYVRSDTDTEDISSPTWWTKTTEMLADACEGLKVDGVCSPAPVIRQEYSISYYEFLISLGNTLHSRLANGKIRMVQTALVRLADLVSKERVMEVASILTRTKAKDLYLNFFTDVVPRREIPLGDEVRGGMQLIRVLQEAGLRVLVGFVSTDIILWKSAGAWSCATGKYFNLRRFTPSRWDDEGGGGGGQLPYWFEESLLAFFREGDVLRLRKAGIIDDKNISNPYSQKILALFDNPRLTPEDRKKWLSLAWCQFMYWFASVEKRINEGLDAEDLLIKAEQGWLKLDEIKFLAEELKNDGAWIRQWRRGLREFRAPE